jgi:hypothetical protein
MALGALNDLHLNQVTVAGNRIVSTGGTSSFLIADENLYAGDTLTLSNSKVMSNTLSVTGGADTFAITAEAGTYSNNNTTITGSTINGNSAKTTVTGGGGFIIADDTVDVGGLLTMTGSTISRNSATAKGTVNNNFTASSAAGAFADHATIKNSTIALNHATATSAGASGNTFSQGGGILLNNGTPTTLTDVTIAGNSALGTGPNLASQGGGIYAGNNTALKSTIVGKNSAATGPDCFTGLTSNGYNLISKTAGCGWVSGPGDKTNKDPKLGTLGNHGGPTQTMLLKGTSPALNAVPTTVCPIHVDQRGVHRPQGPKCDMGAVEDKASDLTAPLRTLRAPVIGTSASSGGAASAIKAARAKVDRIRATRVPNPATIRARYGSPFSTTARAEAIRQALRLVHALRARL